MQLPKRRSQTLKKQEERDNYLTPDKIERLKRDLIQLQKVERPKTVEDLSNALKLGDFSENAEYQDAKARLARIDGRVFSLKERIKNAIPIEYDPASKGTVQIGSSVVMESAGRKLTYEIVGSQESDPSRGRISRHSPLGQILLGHVAGDVVSVATEQGDREYRILEVR
ncbi:MAG: transcription elongation factor GreA [Patescibacteria group bacterium]